MTTLRQKNISGFGSIKYPDSEEVIDNDDEEKKCRCPSCGIAVSQLRGVPCFQQKCPRCNSSMVQGE
jgi:Zn finger protein HypA/HybF involved in hydrogenase expression